MNNETVLKITYLEGYAGLRLKSERDLEIKKGINLLVGRNGSGKSALTDLVDFIFADFTDKSRFDKISHLHKLMETGFVEPLYDKVIEHYEKLREDNPRANQSELQIKLTKFVPPDRAIKIICPFELNHNKGEIIIKQQSAEIDQYIKTLNNRTFLDTNAPLTIARNINNSSKPKNYEILRVEAGTSLEDIASFEFGVSFKDKVKSIKPTDHNKSSDSSIYNPFITNINDSFLDRYNEFLEKEKTRILDELKQIEKNLSGELKNYWEQVIKKIKVQKIEEQDRFKFTFILEDGENEITFDTLSGGEKNLLNLIVKLNAARETKPDLIIIDEPEVYMHDDMIRKLVAEISTLADDLPETCILLSSHNTALIEEVASLDKPKVNLIVFEDKKVYNSEQDIDFINALHDNGVRFSPLMISRKPNLFIENLGDDGAEYRDFYLKFFDPKNQPNIVYVGGSNEVKGYHKFLIVLENILKADTSQNNRGIIDGDIWLTEESRLQNYLFGESELDELVDQLINQKEFYIPHPTNFSACYFNCWEIENIYLVEELLAHWKSSNANSILDLKTYKQLLKYNKDKICETWNKTFIKSLFGPIYFRKLDGYENKLNEAHEKISRIQKLIPTIKNNFSIFFDKLLEEDLLHWIPGKEIKCELEKNHYTFNSDDIDFEELAISKKIREIIH